MSEREPATLEFLACQQDRMLARRMLRSGSTTESSTS
jgi:hypothetical protein